MAYKLFPDSTQQECLKLAAGKKHDADNRIQQFASIAIQSLLTDMFQAGYRAAMRDHNIPLPTEKEPT